MHYKTQFLKVEAVLETRFRRPLMGTLWDREKLIPITDLILISKWDNTPLFVK
jgi:hypothetical protein